jgi:fructose-1,6-bisphosphatase I
MTTTTNQKFQVASGQTEEERAVNPITLTRFITTERMQFQHSTGNFALLLQSIQLGCKTIAQATRKAGIGNLYGLSGTTNSTGDSQKKLDIFANDVMINCLSYSNQAYLMISEECEEPIIIEGATPEQKHSTERGEGAYAVVFDPLDGSSNIDCNLSVGTIFGIYRKKKTSTLLTANATPREIAADALRPGSELLAAGYCSYDAATMLTLTTGLGVNMFTLDPTIGEFILTHQNIKIPENGKIYSINEGNSKTWDSATKEFIAKQKESGKISNRYVGSMVGDIHRTLLYGGIFCYPADQKNPNGKLRLLYECNPISYIIEQAGGKSTTGTQRILDIQPKAIHERCPIFCGSKKMVEDVEAIYAKHQKNKSSSSSLSSKL